MKKCALFFLSIVVVFSSCSNKFKVGADYKDVTVVYGLLSKSDTANYIKVTKGFFDETADNLLLASNSDSIYYNNLEVKIEEINNGSIVNTFFLPRVDANLEGFPKQPGTFADTPNYAYKFKQNLNPARTYRVVVKNLSNGNLVYAETGIINDASNVFNSVTPVPIPNFDRLNFDSPNGTYTFEWSSPPNAAFFDVNIRFWYQEKNTQTNNIVHKYIDLPVVKNVLSSGGSTSGKMSNETFFRTLNSELGPAAANIVRYIDTPDVLILAGGTVLKTYIDVNSAQGGITYDQIKPNYTNFVGENVLGILSTRATKYVVDVPFGVATIDSIWYGSMTKNLQFAGISSE